MARRDSVALEGLLLLVALASASLLGAALLAVFPGSLPDSTDVVGYPIFWDFNISSYFHRYYVIVAFVPGVTILGYVALRVVARRIGWPIAARHRSAPGTESAGQVGETPPRHPLRGRLEQVLRSCFAGAVLGLEVAVGAKRVGVGVGVTMVGMATASVGVVELAGRCLRVRRTQWQGSGIRSAVNAALVPLTVLGLIAVSHVSEVAVPGQSADRYPFLPWWLGVTAAGAVAAVLLTGLRNAMDPGKVTRIEHQAMLFVVGPVALFLLLARVPGALGGVDFFHEGEALGAVGLTQSGLFPWRDFAIIHGPFEDIVRPWVGMAMLEDSRWGARAGQALLLVPLYWVAHYCLLATVFRRVSLAVLGTLVMAATVPDNLRLLLWPLILLALGAALRGCRPAPSARLTMLLFAQVVLSPEAVFAVPACGLAILGYESARARHGPLRWRSFRRTLTCLVVGSVLSLGWLAYLAFHGAADDYVRQVLMFGRDHQLTGGLPLSGHGLRFWFGVYVPVLAVLTTIAYVAARVRTGRPVSVEDWVVIAAAIMTALYYTKFLARADEGHSQQSLAMSSVLVILLVGRVVWAARSWPGRRPRRSGWAVEPVAAALLVVLCAAAARPPVSLSHRISELRLRFATGAPGPPWLTRLGYANPDPAAMDLVAEVESLLRTYLAPGDRVFDFTNQPALFHYLLERLPSSRYYHVSMAIRRPTQRQLVAELERHRPRLVFFDHEGYGLPIWDGIPNAVRHYEVSQYLLETYRPLVALGGYLVLVANELPPRSLPLPPSDPAGTAGSRDLLFRTHPCTWGAAPNFLDSRPVRAGGAVSLPVKVVSPTLLRIDVPGSVRLADFRWFEIETSGPLRDDEFGLVATDQAAHEDRVVTFRALDRESRQLRVRVGSCPQWHAYTAPTLDLRHGEPQQVRSVRLLR